MSSKGEGRVLAYTGGFAILLYFDVKFSAQGTFADVKYRFPGGKLMLRLKCLKQLKTNLQHILPNPRGGLPYEKGRDARRKF